MSAAAKQILELILRHSQVGGAWVGAKRERMVAIWRAAWKPGERCRVLSFGSI
jgi:hypothetical protein